MPESSVAAGYGPLQCEAHATDQPWQLQIKLFNQSHAPLLILRWHSPLDSWFSEFLQLSQQGQRLPYQGAKAKRGEPTADDFLLLPPGETHIELLDLTQAYQLSNQPLLVQFSTFPVMEHTTQTLTWQPTQTVLIRCPDIQVQPPVIQLP